MNHVCNCHAHECTCFFDIFSGYIVLDLLAYAICCIRAFNCIDSCHCYHNVVGMRVRLHCAQRAITNLNQPPCRTIVLHFSKCNGLVFRSAMSSAVCADRVCVGKSLSWSYIHGAPQSRRRRERGQRWLPKLSA